MPVVVEYGARRTLVVTAVMLAALMQLADTTIVNVALPTIDGALGASVDQGAWFITAYIIANVIIIPLSPWFQTMLGARITLRFRSSASRLRRFSAGLRTTRAPRSDCAFCKARSAAA